jgi:hypothetical protein
MSIAEITDLRSCLAHIYKFTPTSVPKSLELPRDVVDRIRKDAEELSLVRSPKPAPHSAQNPWGTIDRELWEAGREMRKKSEIKVLGVSIVCAADTGGEA